MEVRLAEEEEPGAPGGGDHVVTAGRWEHRDVSGNSE